MANQVVQFDTSGRVSDRVLGPETAPTGLIIGPFTDPEGNLIGVATPPTDQEQDANP